MILRILRILNTECSTARLIGAEDFITIGHILDDTGAAYLEVFQDDDCVFLGLTRSYRFWGIRRRLDTANGIVARKAFRPEVQLLKGNAPFGPISLITAFISPGRGGNTLRCSGPLIRQTFFTGTSPHRPNNLYISDKKTGITSRHGS
jgi:hypothetical protein